MRKSESLTNFLYRQLELTNKWLLFSETKNVTLVALNVAICSALSNFFKDYRLGITVALAGILVSSLISLASFFPNCSNLKEDKEDKEDKSDFSPDNFNGIFWGDIVKIGDPKLYLSFLSERYLLFLDENESKALCLNLAEEIVNNSQIVDNKCKYFKCALGTEVLVVVVMMVMMIVA
jgi:hypothetical protein